MNWFEEQINDRKQNDRESLNSAYRAAVNAIIGESFSFDDAEGAIALILKYYRLPPVKLSDKIKDENDKLSAVCRISGLMQRPVNLEDNWYTCAFGAYLCKKKNSDEYVAAVPDGFGRYSYYDDSLHKRIRLNKKNAALLETEAVCFYKPLPAQKLSVGDMLKFGVSAWSVSDYLFIIIALAAATLIGFLTPELSRFMFSTVIEEGKISLLLSTMLFMICVSMSTLMLETIRNMFVERNCTKMSAALQSAAMMRLLSLPTGFFRRYSSGEISTRIGYIDNICTSISDTVFSTTLSGLFSLAYITQIFKFAPKLVLPSLLVILANMLFMVYTALRQMKISKKQMELNAANSGMAVGMISGIQKIKMAGAEKRMFAKYTKAFSNEAKVTYNPPFFNKYNTVIALAISLAGQLIIYYITLGENIGVADYYAFHTSYGMISAAIASLVGVALEIANLRPSLEMVKPILNEIPENSENADEVTSLSGSIEINNVSFRYTENGPDIIKDFSTKIKSGEYVAIVGKTGCGKSTLIRLLLGFEKPQSGSIYYDGKDLNKLEKRSLRQKIGTVMQDDRLFTGDIYSNIVICAPTLSLDSAWEAAEIAGIADDIRDMPMGMFTLISEGAGGISGGQRQRIAIARAIAPKPKILVFDEATSALDNITQKKVSDALDSLKCTRIVIAHRLSTIRHCDRIIVIDSGRITEEGTYEELVAQNGYFASLVERQRLDK